MFKKILIVNGLIRFKIFGWNVKLLKKYLHLELRAVKTWYLFRDTVTVHWILLPPSDNGDISCSSCGNRGP